MVPSATTAVAPSRHFSGKLGTPKTHNGAAHPVPEPYRADVAATQEADAQSANRDKEGNSRVIAVESAGEENRDILKKEIDDRHNYTRLILQIFAGWFAFFVTSVLGILGWTVSTLRDGSGRLTRPVLLDWIAFFFTIQTIFGLIACRDALRDIKFSKARISKIHASMRANEDIAPQDPTPQCMVTGLQMIRYALYTLIAFLFAVCVIFHW